MARIIFRTPRLTLLATCTVLTAMLLPMGSWAQSINSAAFVSVTVNSAADGTVQPDDALTLREAIEITNGTLPISQLSEMEKQLVVPHPSRSDIRFNLPADQTEIALNGLLPALNQAGLVLDGATQPGYDENSSVTAEISIPVPVVTLRPADGVQVFRGLTVSASDVTIRGLNLYGFNSSNQITQSTPPANIFITHRPTPLNREAELPFSGSRKSEPPTGIVIENNWLGLTTDGSIPAVSSGFGISVFDSTGTQISRNRIEYHNGSGIITGRQADNLEIKENILVGNGLSGMPDAIRMDGSVRDGFITSNLICGNDGSGIFLFKPQGAVTIADNNIRFNGQRLRRSAIYLMGSDHRVIDNRITNQKGSGVTVTAYGRGPNTQSANNVITGNRFNHLEGLSIDLNARRDRTPQGFQRGDGPNPPRNSGNRRQDTGNSAVNAPNFASVEFFIIDGSAVIRGEADPNSEVQLYRVNASTSESFAHYGPLSEPVGIAAADEDGMFEFVLDGVNEGERFSAISTDARYGTSEPALNTALRALSASFESEAVPVAAAAATMPQCTTPPAPPESPELPTLPELPELPDVIRLEVPRNVHFGLDQDFISAESKPILDKIVEVLGQYPTIVVDLHGHTDSRASDAYNQDLARRRAENARRYLLSQGIGAERMTIRSLGETQLRVEETSLENFARNRRVEFVFTDLQGAEIVFFDQEEDLQIEP
ncbi:MAG: OmpA family protein [Phormidesmis sp.]